MNSLRNDRCMEGSKLYDVKMTLLLDLRLVVENVSGTVLEIT